MSELVDRDAVLNIIDDIKLNYSIPKNYGTLLDIERKIRQLPTTKSSEIIHAHWDLDSDGDYFCSHCDCYANIDFYEYEGRGGKVRQDLTHRCPCCDAIMDEEINDDREKK